MVVVYLTGHLKSLTGGVTEFALDEDVTTVGDALNEIWQRHPALRDRILNEQGEIRPHVNIFLGSNDVKRTLGLETIIDATEIHIFNAVSGG